MHGRSLRLHVDTQENLTDETMSRVMSLLDKYGHFCFLEDREIDTLDLVTIPPLPSKEKGEKSKSQRLRAVMYLVAKQRGVDTELFYNQQMESLIEKYKEKLD